MGCEPSGPPATDAAAATLRAVELVSPADAREACGKAGEFQGWCEERWVLAAQARGLSEAELLSGCATDSCRFFVLDQSREPDVLLRIERCVAEAGVHGGDCASHALLRWVATRPDATEIARVGPALRDPWFGAYTLGRAAGCAGLDACPALPSGGLACAIGRRQTPIESGFCHSPGPTRVW